ncbi:hypothetical protein EBR04_08250 [bacterium]|nr:hypothetical protein [bacterium]
MTIWLQAFRLTAVFLAAALFAAPGAATFGQDAAVADAVAITPDEAAAHAGKECVVTMRVNSSRHMADAGRCYLNSLDDHRDEKNFTVVIFRRGLEDLARSDIGDPAEHFLDKTIRVTGTVEMYKEKPQIKVDRAEQIELVPEADGAAAGQE